MREEKGMEMNTTWKRVKWVRRGLAALLAGVLASGPAEAAFLILKGDRKVEGTSISVSARGQYIIEMATGRQSYDAGQVLRAEADKPAQYDRAMQFVGARKYDQALPLFQEIVESYKRLTWDNQANMMIARIYTRTGKPKDAVALFTDLPKSFFDQPDVRFDYWQAMVGAGEFEVLEKDLDDAVATGDRELAARAQIVRGDIKLKRAQFEPAAIDYLRTVVLYKAIEEVQPEALYKAIQALEELRDGRTSDLKERLLKNYPESEYARRLQQG
jgi:outer membrane protein assembly factor BamD (BamD/ComL family)